MHTCIQYAVKSLLSKTVVDDCISLVDVERFHDDMAGCNCNVGLSYIRVYIYLQNRLGGMLKTILH